MSKFGGIAVEEAEAPVSTSRFGGVPVETAKSFDDLSVEEQERLLGKQPQLQKPDPESEQVTGSRDDFPEVNDPSFMEQLYGATRREVEPAAAATLMGAAMGSAAGGAGAVPGALAGLAAYGLSRAAGAFAPIVGIEDPFDQLEQFYTDIGVPEPKDEAIKTLRVVFQSATAGPTGITRKAAQKFGQAAASGMAIGAGEAVAFETAAEVAEYLDVDKLALPAGIIAAILAGQKLTPKQVDEIVAASGSRLPKPKDLNLKETAELAKEATKSKSAKRQLADQFAPDEDVLQAAKELEVDEFMSPDLVTTNRAATETAQAVKSYAAGPARTAEFESLEQIGNRTQKLLEDFGATQDLAGLSNKIKSDFRATIDSLDDEATRLFGKVSELLPEKTRGAATETLDFLNKKLNRLDGKVEQLTRLEKKALKILTPDEGKLPTYESMEAIRREIGKGLKKAGEFKDEDIGVLKKLYGLISDDQLRILDNVEDAGIDLSSLKRSANEAVKIRKSIEDDMIRLFGKKLDESIFFKLGKETSALTKRDADKFADLLNAVPKEFRQEALISAMDTTFAKHASSGNLNFASFSKWYDKLKSNKTAHGAFMEALDPKARKAIDNIAKVSGSISRATNKKIYTGRLNDVTDQLKQADNLWGSLAKKALIAAGAEAVAQSLGSRPGTGITSVLTASLMRGKKDKAIDALNKLLVDPEFVMMTRESVKQAPSIKQQLINRIANLEAFVRFARIVNMSTQEERLQFVQDALNDTKEEGQNGN